MGRASRGVFLCAAIKKTWHCGADSGVSRFSQLARCLCVSVCAPFHSGNRVRFRSFQVADKFVCHASSSVTPALWICISALLDLRRQALIIYWKMRVECLIVLLGCVLHSSIDSPKERSIFVDASIFMSSNF